MFPGQHQVIEVFIFQAGSVGKALVKVPSWVISIDQMPMRMTKGSSNRSSICDLREASNIMKDDDVATHCVLEHSEGRVFSVVV